MPAVYAGDDGRAPDSAFVAGALRLLMAGNRGRLLDARRTPITVVDVAPERGSFTVRVDAFEDAGARWELGLEEVGRFQFARTAAHTDEARLAELRDSVARFDRDIDLVCDERARERSLRGLGERRASVRASLGARIRELAIDVAAHIARREGHPALYALVAGFLAERELGELERTFTTAFVTNPRAGEVVKGHSIVLAELGLSPYRGKAPRDPDLFAGSWSRPRRADHLLWRLALTQELWTVLGARDLVLYRAAATDGAFGPPVPGGLVSATFSREVADAHFEGGPSTRVAVLWRQHVPVERALMTFLETQAMNRRFREAEVILLADPSNHAF